MLKPPRSMRKVESKRATCKFYGEKGIPPTECACTECSDVHACVLLAKERAWGDTNPNW